MRIESGAARAIPDNEALARLRAQIGSGLDATPGQSGGGGRAPARTTPGGGAAATSPGRRESRLQRSRANAPRGGGGRIATVRAGRRTRARIKEGGGGGRGGGREAGGGGGAPRGGAARAPLWARTPKSEQIKEQRHPAKRSGRGVARKGWKTRHAELADHAEGGEPGRGKKARVRTRMQQRVRSLPPLIREEGGEGKRGGEKEEEEREEEGGVAATSLHFAMLA